MFVLDQHGSIEAFDTRLNPALRTNNWTYDDELGGSIIFLEKIILYNTSQYYVYDIHNIHNVMHVHLSGGLVILLQTVQTSGY